MGFQRQRFSRCVAADCLGLESGLHAGEDGAQVGRRSGERGDVGRKAGPLQVGKAHDSSLHRKEGPLAGGLNLEMADVQVVDQAVDLRFQPEPQVHLLEGWFRDKVADRAQVDERFVDRGADSHLVGETGEVGKIAETEGEFFCPERRPVVVVVKVADVQSGRIERDVSAQLMDRQSFFLLQREVVQPG